MKFKYSKVSERWSGKEKEQVEINSMEELMEFIEKFDEDVIISKDKTIEIFDDYL